MANTFTNVQAREVDFVSRFSQNWDALREILGVTRPIKKVSGTKLISYTAQATSGLAQSPAAGQQIPYTDITVTEAAKADITIEKYAKAVTIEDVSKYGAAVAIQKTDDAFLNELQSNVMGRFYTFLNTGSLVAAESSFQMALAMAKGLVIDKFNTINKTVTEVVGFANVLDVYQYLGGTAITVQTMFGIQYVKDFMGYKTLFLLSAPQIARGTVIATPVENIDLYYVDPADSDFADLGLQYTVDGETPLIGFHANGNYNTAVGEEFALMGITLWAEYLDGIAVVTVDDSFLTDLTVTADAADATYPWTDKKPADFQSDIAVADGKVTGSLKFIDGGLSPSGPLAGDGYFLALKFDNYSSGLTYANVQVGIVPSASGMALQTLDSDKNAVFKVTDKDNQKIKIVQSDTAGHKNIQILDLRDLELEPEIGA